MAYIDKAFYDTVLKGTEILDNEFDRLAEIASDVVYDVCILKPDEEDLKDEAFKKAVAYQVEMLYLQGGVDAIVGASEAAQAGGSESLGDYSTSSGTTGHAAVLTCNGIPVSSMAVALLRRLGLMARWAYAGRCYGKP